MPIRAEAFDDPHGSVLYWLGMAGFLIHARGTLLAVDPLLQDFDMPVLIDLPLQVEDVPRLDAVLVTHADNDHFSVPTCMALNGVTQGFHSNRYVAELMQELGMAADGHGIGDAFSFGGVRVTVTPADHAWQNAASRPGQRTFEMANTYPDADLLVRWRAVQELDLGKECVLECGPQRHQLVSHEQRHLARDRSHPFHNGLADPVHGHLRQLEYTIRLGLVVDKQICDLSD
jgi:hypothetical protein